MSDVVNQLFASLPPSRLTTFSCGHIIPTSNLQALVLKKGPRGGELTFKFQQRGDDSLVCFPVSHSSENACVDVSLCATGRSQSSARSC